MVYGLYNKPLKPLEFFYFRKLNVFFFSTAVRQTVSRSFDIFGPLWYDKMVSRMDRPYRQWIRLDQIGSDWIRLDQTGSEKAQMSLEIDLQKFFLSFPEDVKFRDRMTETELHTRTGAINVWATSTIFCSTGLPLARARWVWSTF